MMTMSGADVIQQILVSATITGIGTALCAHILAHVVPMRLRVNHSDIHGGAAIGTIYHRTYLSLTVCLTWAAEAIRLAGLYNKGEYNKQTTGEASPYGSHTSIRQQVVDTLYSSILIRAYY